MAGKSPKCLMREIHLQMVGFFHPMTDPWDERYIYLHGWLIFMVNVGKYTSPMDPIVVSFRGCKENMRKSLKSEHEGIFWLSQPWKIFKLDHFPR